MTPACVSQTFSSKSTMSSAVAPCARMQRSHRRGLAYWLQAEGPQVTCPDTIHRRRRDHCATLGLANLATTAVSADLHLAATAFAISSCDQKDAGTDHKSAPVRPPAAAAAVRGASPPAPPPAPRSTRRSAAPPCRSTRRPCSRCLASRLTMSPAHPSTVCPGLLRIHGCWLAEQHLGGFC